MKRLSFTILGLCAYLWAEAGGFQVVLQGVRQTGMGNTGSALADVSNMFYNPGAIGFIEGGGVAAGVNAIFGKTEFASLDGSIYKTENPVSTPFYLHAAFGFGKNKAIKAGLSVVTPYGSTVKWEDGWIGKTYLEQIALRAIYIQPTVAYRVNEKFSVGAGFQYMTGSVNLQRQNALPVNGLFVDAELDGKATGMGWNLGVAYKLFDEVTLGLAYRSKIIAKVEDGTATFTNIPSLGGPVGAAIAGNFPNLSGSTASTKFSSELPLPAVLTAGVTWKYSDNLLFNFDARYTFWSAYKELAFNFTDPVAGSNTSISPRQYQDRITIGAGAEYKKGGLAIRGGTYFDPSPVKDGFMTAETPDANTFAGTLGLGYSFGKVSIDLGGIYLTRPTRDNRNPATDANGNFVGPRGDFKTKAVVGTFGVTFNF
ncbi:OmpP1/FadL family transporter [Raineya orbicola]|uniref:Long-chain fatty acid transport protein n=1 Tax=Raineya orbicola TaxID=2016530 RepID=A0A2N3IKN7_9BACT|nr:outer membrane protein transport protein [Raineya orbicola]PKQ70773.1 Long-chain fatty acid transport protein [Raineya orbicola]